MAPRRHATPNGGPVVCRYGSPARSPFSTPRQSPPNDCAAPAPAPAPAKQPTPPGVAPAGQPPHAVSPQDPMPDRWRPLGTPEAQSSIPGADTGPALPSALHSEPQAQGVADAWAGARAQAQAQEQACGDQGYPLTEQGAERLQPGSFPAQGPVEASSLLRPFPGNGSEQGSQLPERDGESAGEGQGMGSGAQFLGPMEVNSVWAAVMERLEQESAAQAAGEGAQQVGGQGQEQGQEEEGEEDSGCAMDIDGVAEISERFLGTRLDKLADGNAVSQQPSFLSHLTWGESAQSLDSTMGPTPAAEPLSEGAAQAAGLFGAFSMQGFMGGGDIVPGSTFPAPALQSPPPQAPTPYAPQGPVRAPHQQATPPADNNLLPPLAAHSQAPELSLRRRLLLQQAGAAEAAAAAGNGSGAEGAGTPGFRRRDFLPTILESGGLPAGGARRDLSLETASSPGTGFGAHLDLPSPGPQPSTPFPGSASTPGRFSRREVPRQRLEPSQPLASQLSPSLAALLSVLSNENEAERRRGGPGAAGGISSGIGSGSGAGAGGGAGGVASVGFPDLEMELTPTLSALLSILAFDAEPDSPPRLQASRSCQPARSESELALCELELDMDEPHGLQRQSSLDSGIPGRKSRGSLGPSPTGSLHSSPRESPVRTRESSLHSTPSPVLQRRFTGNRVSVVNQCWQAGAGRRGEAGPSGLRSVSEVLEEEGTAAFYRGFKADASPVRPNSKRTKRDCS